MKRKSNKIMLALSLATLISASTVVPVLAQTDTDVSSSVDTGVFYDFKEEDMDNLNSRSTEWPSRVWNISSQGMYHFAGESAQQTLYTNYLFKGKSAYTVLVENQGSSTITVNARKGILGLSFYSVKVKPGETKVFDLKGLSSRDRFSLSFSGSGSRYLFRGYIRAY